MASPSSSQWYRLKDTCDIVPNIYVFQQDFQINTNFRYLWLFLRSWDGDMIYEEEEVPSVGLIQ